MLLSILSPEHIWGLIFQLFAIFYSLVPLAADSEDIPLLSVGLSSMIQLFMIDPTPRRGTDALTGAEKCIDRSRACVIDSEGTDTVLRPSITLLEPCHPISQLYLKISTCIPRVIVNEISRPV